MGGAPECHTGEFICRDAETSLGCDDGKWQARPCGAASLCVAGGCLSGLDGGGGVALESLLEPLGAGWLRKRAGPRLLRAINVVAGLSILAFGVVQLASLAV